MKNILFFFIFLLFVSQANATTQVVQYFTHTPVSVCQPSDSNSNCGSGTGTNYWSLSPGNVGINTTNNVGIGSASPNQALVVIGTASVSNSIVVGTGAATITGDANGNVGIGSASPGQKLDVSGTARATNLIDTGVTASTLAYYDANKQLSSVTLTTTGSSGASTFSGGTLNIPQYSGGAGSNFWIAANVGIGTLSNVAVGTTSSTNVLTVKGDASFTGNVGIGTDLPQGPLQIKAATNQNGFFQGNQNLSDGIAFSSVNDANSANQSLELRGSTVQLSSIGNNPINFLTNDSGNLQTTIRMVIGGGGNVGIGTSTAPNLLYVAGTAEMQGFKMNKNASNGFVLTSNSVGVGTWMPASGGGGSGTVTSVTLATPNSTLTLGGTNPVTTSGTINADLNLTNANTWTGQQIFNTANVGINSASPGQWLDVNGTIRSTQMIDTGITASKVVVTDTNKQLTAATNLADLAYCQTGGTNCPGSITGFANPSATIGLSANNGAATTAMRSDATPALGVTISPTWTGNHTFAPSSGNTLFTAGNIGIGTSTNINGLVTIFGNVGISSSAPGAALDVNGAGRFLGTGNTTLNPTSGNVGIGTTLQDASITYGYTAHSVASTTVGRVRCFGLSTLGAACDGYCTSISTDTCACTCI